MQRVLTRMLLVALPVFGCGTGDSGTQTVPTSSIFPQGGQCSPHDAKVTVSVDETKAPAPLQLRIESCRMDEDACMDMCTYELANLPAIMAIFGLAETPVSFDGGGIDLPANGDQFQGNTPSSCHVTFDGGTANSDIGFQTFDTSGGCGFAEPGTNGGGTSQGSGTSTPPVGGP